MEDFIKHVDNGGKEEWVPTWNEDGFNARKMDHELWTYYRRLERMLEKEVFTTPQAKVDFVQGIIVTLVGNLPHNESEFLAQLNDTAASKILEKIIQMGTERQIRHLFSHFKKRFFLLATGKFSSFFLQKILNGCALILQNERSLEFPEKDEVPSMTDMFVSMLDELSSKWNELISHKYGSHILRAIVQVLVKDEYFEKLGEIIDILLENVPEEQWFLDPVVSPVLVLLLESTSNAKAFNDRLQKMVIKRLDTSEKILAALNSVNSSRVVDACIKSCDDKMIIKLYKKIWKKNIKMISLSFTGNYSVSFILNRLPQKYFEEAFDNLKGSFADIFRNTRGVLITLAENCVKYDTRQDVFLASWDLLNQDDFIRQVLVVGANIDRTGCNLLKSLAKFHNTEKLASRFSEFDQLIDLAFDKSGSLLTEALIPICGDKIFPVLKESLVKLSCDVYGCRVVQTLYQNIKVDYKIEFHKTLLANETLVENKFGRIVFHNCGCKEFKNTNNLKKWKAEQLKNLDRKREFQDIIQDNTISTKTPKKTKQHHTTQESVSGDLSFIFNAIKGTNK